MTTPTSNQNFHALYLKNSKEFFSGFMAVHSGLTALEFISGRTGLFRNSYRFPVDLFFALHIAIPLSVLAGKLSMDITRNMFDQAHNIVPFVKKTLLAAANALPGESIATDLKPEEATVKA